MDQFETSSDYADYLVSSGSDYANTLLGGTDYELKSLELDRAAELKRQNLYRKGKLQYETDGELIHDSNNMIRAKEAANVGIDAMDWLLEASENVMDFGQGDALNNSKFMAENQGRKYHMENKDFIGARETTTQDLINEYQSAQHDPNSEAGIYTLKKFDGYNSDGSEKFLYKFGTTKIGADSRYKDQAIRDGYEIVEEKRFAGAEDWEHRWNASEGVLDARTLDSSRVNVDGTMMSRDEASGVGFGSGYTELLNEDLLGTDEGKTKEDYATNKAYSERLTKVAEQRYKDGLDDSMIDAFQSGGAKLVVDTADFILDVFTPGDNTMLNDAKKQENIDKWVGYDRTGSTQVLNAAKNYWKQGDYFSAIGKVLTDPNTMVESLPIMLGMMAPIPGTRAATLVRIAKGISTAKKVGETAKVVKLTDALKKATSAKEFAKFKELETLSTTTKALDHFARNAGFHTYVGVSTNNILDERIAAKLKAGEEPNVDMGEVLGVYGTQMLMLSIDRLAFAEITGLDKGAQLFKDTFKAIPKEGKAEVFKKIATKAATIVADGAGEGAQEYVQTWGEILGASVGIDGQSIGDVLSNTEKQDEALMGFLGGIGAGTQTGGISTGVKTAYEMVKGKVDKELATEDIPQPEQPENTINTDLREAMATSTAFEADTIDTSTSTMEEFISNPTPENTTKLSQAIELEKSILQSLHTAYTDETANLTEAQSTHYEQEIGNAKKRLEILTAVKEGKFTPKTETENSTVEFEEHTPTTEAKEDGTYDKTEVLAELKSLLTSTDGKESLLDTMIKNFDKVNTEDDLDIKQYKLGSSTVALNRFKDARTKLENSTLTTEEQAQADNYSKAIDNYEVKLQQAIYLKINDASVEEVLAMKPGEAVDTFGSTKIDGTDQASKIIDGTGNNNFTTKATTKDQENYNNATAETDWSSWTDSIEALPEYLDKVEAIQNAQGDTSGAQETNNLNTKIKAEQTKTDNAKKAGRKKKAEKKKKATAKGIIEDDIYATGGIVDQIGASNVSHLVIEAAEAKLAETTAFTEKWIADNIEPDGRTPTIEEFLGKGETRWNRKGYYESINKSTLISIKDANANIAKVGRTNNSLKATIKAKIATKRSKINDVGNVLTGMKNEIIQYIDTILKDGIEKVETTTEELSNFSKPINGSNKIAVTSPEQAWKAVYNHFGSKEKVIDLGGKNKPLKAAYSTLIAALESDKPHNREILYVLSALNEEAKIYERLLDADGNFTVGKEDKDRSKEVKKKQAKENKANAETVVDGDGNSVALFDSSTRQAIEKKLEARLAHKEHVTKEIAEYKDVQDNSKETIVSDGVEYEIPVFESNFIDSAEALNLVNEKGTELETLSTYVKEKFKELVALRKELGKTIAEDKTTGAKLKSTLKTIRTLTNKVADLKVQKQALERKLKVAKSKNVPLMSKVGQIIAGAFVRFFKGTVSLEKDLEAIDKKITNLERELAITTKADAKLAVKARKIKDSVTKQKKATKKVEGELDAIVGSNKVKDTLDSLKDFKDSRQVRRARLRFLKTKARLLSKRISKLKNKLEKPHYTAKILQSQGQNSRTLTTRGEVDTKAIEARDKSGLPTNFLDFVAMAKKAKSILSQIPISKIPIKNNKLKEMSTEGIQFLENIGMDKLIKTLKNYNHFRSPSMALLRTSENEVDENVIAAIVIGAKTSLRNQASKLFFTDEEQTGIKLGLNEFEVTPELQNMFKHKTSRASLANDIGGVVFDLLDFKPARGKNASSEAYSRLKTSLGLIGILYLENQGILKNTSMNLSVYNDLVGNTDNVSDNTEDGQPKVNFVELVNQKPLPQDVSDKLAFDLDILENLNMLPQAENSVQWSEPEEKTAEEIGVRGTEILKPTKLITKAINLLNKQAFNLVDGVRTQLDKFSRDESLKIMGYVPDTTIDAMQISEKSKLKKKAANIGILKEYDELMILSGTIESDVKENKFWFNWFTPSNGRLNIMSSLIDPQNGKEFHRWLVTPINQIVTFSKSDILANKDSVAAFKLGIAQAFKHDIDKTSVKTSYAFADKILGMTDAQLREKIISGEIDHFGHAIQALKAIEQFRNTADGGTFDATITAEFDGLTNGTILKTMQMPVLKDTYGILYKGALVFKGKDNSMYRVDENGERVELQKGVDFENFNSMLVEIEDSNDGRAKDKSFVGRVLDVYFSQGVIARISRDEMGKSVEEYNEAKSTDKRKVDIDPLNLLDSDDYFMDFIPNIKDGLTKALRDLLKDPTMTTNYGSALATVRKNIARLTTDKMIDKLIGDYTAKNKKGDTAEEVKALNISRVRATEVLERMATKYGTTKKPLNVKSLVEQLQTADISKIGGKVDGKGLEESLNTLFEHTLGKAISDAVEATFGPMIEITEVMNVTSRFMMRVFEQALETKINEKIAELQKDAPEGKAVLALDNDQILEITKSLSHLMPIMAGPGSSDRLEDGIGIFDSRLAKDDELKFSDNKPKVSYVGTDGKSVSFSARVFVRKLGEAYSAAGVLPTHHEDAIGLAKTLEKHLEKYGIVTIHDAMTLNGGIAEILQTINEAYVETSKDYDSVNSLAKAARAVYDKAVADGNINLDDMSSKSEIEANGDEHIPISFLEQVLRIETEGERTWTAKRELYADDLKIDQVPGTDSLIEVKAKYIVEQYQTELKTRIYRRASLIKDSDLGKMLKTDEDIDTFVNSVLNTKGIKGEKNKITYNIKQIKIITKVLNGEC